MKDLKVEYLPINAVVPYSGNARTHSAAQIKQIARSMQQFGFMNPLLVDGKNQAICGHGRLLAAKKLGLQRVPVLRIEHLDEVQRRAYMLADNKIALNAGWDPELLKVELTFLMEIDFDVDLTGFSTPEIDLAMQPLGDEPDDPVPDLPALGAVVSKMGDIWELGGHRIACGDCREPGLLKALMSGKQARMVLTDPPYNVPIDGHVSGLGKTQHPEFAMASGEMSSPQFVEFLRASIAAAADQCMDAALLYLFMDWRHLAELQMACAALKLDLINLCVWVKSNGGMGSLYRSQHELVLVVKKGKGSHVNNVELGKHGRYRTNVWPYAGMNSFGQERDEALALHPTVKPVALVVDAIKDVTHHGDIVLDSFLGSGTTLIAAERCQRRCYGAEIDPRYVDVALQRWIALTGQQPVHAQTGQTYEQLRDSRAVASVEA